MKRTCRRAKETDKEHDGLTPPERVCSILRDIQWETNCSSLSVQRLLDSLRGRLGESMTQCQAATLGDHHSKTLESKYSLLEGVDSPCFRRKHVDTLSETLVIQIFE